MTSSQISSITLASWSAQASTMSPPDVADGDLAVFEVAARARGTAEGFGDVAFVDGVDLNLPAAATVVEVARQPVGADQVRPSARPVRGVEALQVGFAGAGRALEPGPHRAVADALRAQFGAAVLVVKVANTGGSSPPARAARLWRHRGRTNSNPP